MFSRADSCSRYSSYRFHSHSCRRIVSPTDIAGRRQHWWSSAPHEGSQSSCEECSCIAWHRQRDDSDQLNRERRMRWNEKYRLFKTVEFVQSVGSSRICSHTNILTLYRLSTGNIDGKHGIKLLCTWYFSMHDTFLYYSTFSLSTCNHLLII